MANPLIAKLQHAIHLSNGDKDALRSLTGMSRLVGPDHDLIKEGDEPSTMMVLLGGFACRYRVLPNGRRSIMALLIPGDVCHVPVAPSNRLDHSIATLTPCRIADPPRRAVAELMGHSAAIAQAFWWTLLSDASVQREWFVGVCRRNAAERTAHLFCELLVRLQTVELADASSFALPLTQSELGDILGLSSVHLNRTLQALRFAKLIVLEQGRLTIPDVHRLRAYALFTPEYLHLQDGPNRP